jgi:hypothetical protein
MKIRPMGAELLHADGQRAGMTKLIVAFRNSETAPKRTSKNMNCVIRRLASRLLVNLFSFVKSAANVSVWSVLRLP